MRTRMQSLGLMILGLLCGALPARVAAREVQICVQDHHGLPLVGAKIQVSNNLSPAASDTSGCATVNVDAQTTVEITKDGFSRASRSLTEQNHLVVVMQVAALVEDIQVTAARAPLALDASASSVRMMTGEQLREAPGFTLDDRLRQVAGFQLFRRTSSWVANPTTEGTTLRGLGSTAASRTLVLSDQVPLNDAYGGWIHWSEIPALAMRDVELMRGGASDLYGSSAIGGVIDVVPVMPKSFGYGLNVAGASEATSIVDGLLTAGTRGWSGLAASSLFRTGGYILTAPEVRGQVDVPSNVHSQSGRVELRRAFNSDGAVFVRGNVLNEARSNGTPLQTNGARIWRYVAGGDWSDNYADRFLIRFYGTDQSYRQSFSSINAARTSEKLTAFHVDPSQQVGGSMQWARSHRQWTFVAGGDVLDNRGTDLEELAKVSLSARQRGEGVYGEVLWQPSTWSFAFSSRFDHFGSFDARQSGGMPPPLPSISENVFNPRLGVVKKINGALSLTGSGFRAFRGPTMNELYRQGQVGQQITLANPSLRAERATGFEFGALAGVGRFGSVRGSYFWTQVNRPVAAVTLSSTPTSTLLMRENLGQLTSKGLTAEWELRPASWMSVIGGYQLAFSTVTKFQADPTLVGKWTPQVPRNMATLQMRFSKQRVGVFSVDLRTSGHQFDDSANQFRLAGYGQVDLYGEHSFGERWRIYLQVQNLLNQPVEAGRTPLLTLGAPATLTGGVRFSK
ncbi:MAG TPA: TonB-dependent receptor [Edaphobacter sp.]|jgi:outer membrane receptor protein involved in Fe transport|nr:TonB-dependent receptor [Edaphobacter sp.]